MATTTRFEMRMNPEVKAKAEKASSLRGYKSLAEYVNKVVGEDASQVLAEHEGFTVEDSIFDMFFDACSKADQPNSALRDAAQYAKEHGF